MKKNELRYMWAYLGEAEAALDLIVNDPEHSCLGGTGDQIFRQTIEVIRLFRQKMTEKYGDQLFEWHEPQ
jgi:hypothetical protein